MPVTARAAGGARGARAGAIALAIVVAVALVGGAARRAHARPYPVFVDVGDEDELRELAERGDLDDDEATALDELLARGVDLARADRAELYALPNLTYAQVDAILAYRAARGGLADPAELVAAGVLDAAELRAIAAFVAAPAAPAAPAVAPSPGRVTRAAPVAPVAPARGARGFIRARARTSTGDRGPPAASLRARVAVDDHVTAGAAVVFTRLRPGPVAWDAARGALVADAPGEGVVVPRAYARWRDDRVDAIVGSFRAGFGERLTFDDTFADAGDGLRTDDLLVHPTALVRACRESAGELATSPCAGAPRYQTADDTWREALFGAAAGARALPLGRGRLRVHGWVSVHRRSIYQYALVDAARCADPRATTAACRAPAFLVRPPGDARAPAPAFAYTTAPDVFRESLAGVDATAFADERTWIGATAYAARTTPLVAGADLDYQEWANRPGGGAFGAIGVHAGAGRGDLDVGAEVTRSFDGMRPAPGAIVHGGGGVGAIVRAIATGRRDVVELSLRYYGVDFVNPYAHPVAARDQLEGQRARDEEGARVRWAGARGALAVRAQAEVWRRLAEGAVRTDERARVDRGLDAPVGWGLEVDYEDRDLRLGGRGQCFDAAAPASLAPDPSSSGADPSSGPDAPPDDPAPGNGGGGTPGANTGAPPPVATTTGAPPALCAGLRVTTTARLYLRPRPALRITAQLTHRLVDDVHHPHDLRRDVMAWIAARYRPSDRVRVHGRLRYLDQDVADPAALETSLWLSGDVTLALRDRDLLRVRADAMWWLDARASTLARTPNPAVEIAIDYQASF